ncbi:protease complex subunit PrcB family protein [Candidatus Woesearchaeota archaeon]|nr:MAG: protease complex subunit PrcB family protein [Candidatus Woesearchaeota archaeon]
MKKLSFLALLLVLVLLVGCANTAQEDMQQPTDTTNIEQEDSANTGSSAVQPAEAEQSPFGEGTPLDFSTLRKGFYSHKFSPAQFVITSEDPTELELMWRAAFKEDPPSIDFNEQEVIALFQGEKPTGGYGISVIRVQDEGDEVVVYYVETVPEGIATQAITSPYHIITIKAQDKPVRFKLVQ